jgi:hypothetical protein
LICLFLIQRITGSEHLLKPVKSLFNAKRMAIEGGMEYEAAYRLSDFYAVSLFYTRILMTKVAPPPSVSRIEILPPWRCTSSFAIHRPSPKCFLSFRDLSAR